MSTTESAASPVAASLGFDGGLTCSLGCSDRKKSIAWYRDVLGFELLYDMDDIGWCELASPVNRVNVGLSSVEKVDTAGGATLTFGVRDIDSARKQLEEKGVRFDGPTREYPGMVKLAAFFDPDDNALMFYQDLSK